MKEWVKELCPEIADWQAELIAEAAQKRVEAERGVLEQELLKLKKGIAANSDYIQGRWDLIGEFQDIIRARGKP